MIYDHDSQERVIANLRKIVIVLCIATTALAGAVFHNFLGSFWGSVETRLNHQIERTDNGR